MSTPSQILQRSVQKPVQYNNDSDVAVSTLVNWKTYSILSHCEQSTGLPKIQKI